MENSLDLEKRYTYADYLTWQGDRRRELANGFIREMSTPNMRHQEISGGLFARLFNVIDKHDKHKEHCKIFPALFDVRLPRTKDERKDKRIYTVVQPDICIVCDPSKLDEKGCLGAPDFVAEIKSESTANYDRHEKFTLYEKAGVREYWIVSPADAIVSQFILQPDGKYDRGIDHRIGKVPIHIFDGLTVDLENVLRTKNNPACRYLMRIERADGTFLGYYDGTFTGF